MAHARGRHPHEHLAPPRRVEHQLLDRWPASRTFEDYAARRDGLLLTHAPMLSTPKSGPYGPPLGMDARSAAI